MSTSDPTAEGGARTPSRVVEQALVDAAERVLVREGLPGLTVRTVAAEAGVAPMGVYNRFGSKEALIAAVLVRGFDGLRAAVAGDGEPDPEARLMASGRSYRRFALDNPQHYAAMFGSRLKTAVETPELAAHSAAAFEALVEHVRYAQAAGTVRAGDPVETAQVIWSAVHGAVGLELAGAVLTPDPGVTYERLLRLIVDGLRA